MNCNKQLYFNSNICFLTKQKSPRQHCCLRVMVPVTGLEPVRVAPADFESATSANSITPACGNDTLILYRTFSFLSSIFNKALCQTSPPFTHIPSHSCIKCTIQYKGGLICACHSGQPPDVNVWSRLLYQYLQGWGRWLWLPYFFHSLPLGAI